MAVKQRQLIVGKKNVQSPPSIIKEGFLLLFFLKLRTFSEYTHTHTHTRAHGLKTELNVWLLETQISHSSQISCVSCRHCTVKYTVKLCSFNCFQTTFIVNKAALKHYIKICCILVSIKRTMNLRLTWSSHWDLHLSKLLSNYLE